MIDWDKFDKIVSEAVVKAGKNTDEKLASGISSITRLTDDEIVGLFPEKADALKLAELMKIVKSAETENIKINRIVENSEKFGKIVFTLLSKLV